MSNTSNQGKRLKKKHKMGFTNKLAICIMFFLAAGLAGGFYLAVLSIKYAYTGALVCYTAAFSPIGTACGIVLARIVDKSRDENTGPNGEGIKYAAAQASNFDVVQDTNDISVTSPYI